MAMKEYNDSKGLSTNAVEIYQRFKTFTLKEMNKAINDALVKAARVIQKQTKQNLKSRLPKSNTRNVTKYKDTLLDAVRVGGRKDKATKSILDRSVHVMGTQSKYSGTYRTRFFEKGTDDRYRKTKDGKKVFCGRIKPLYFFRDAVIATKDEVIQVIDETLEKKINEINDKKF